MLWHGVVGSRGFRPRWSDDVHERDGAVDGNRISAANDEEKYDTRFVVPVVEGSTANRTR